MELKGNTQLFSYFPLEIPEDSYTHASSWYGRIWDLYPLPDGTMNPGRDGPVHGIRAAISPSHDNINFALNNFIQPSLHQDEQWLLNIPRKLERLGVIEAEALLSSDGSAAVRYPEAAV